MLSSLGHELSVDSAAFATQFVECFNAVSALPFLALLEREGILQRLARESAITAVAGAVSFPDEEHPAVIARLWEGLEIDPPQDLNGDWLAPVPPPQQPLLLQRWQELRLQKAMDLTYAHRIDAYFLERRAELERVVYGMIRVRNQGAAEELYLRLIDDSADFASLASTYSLGDERYTHGLVGPMPISQPHPAIRQALTPLAVGDIAPPLRIDDWVLILRMEHREPARLNKATRQLLTTELFEADLAAFLAEQDLSALVAPATPTPAPAHPPTNGITVDISHTPVTADGATAPQLSAPQLTAPPLPDSAPHG